MNAEREMATADGLGGEHLHFVEVVEVYDRSDGVYVFGDLGAAERFKSAVVSGSSDVHRQETPVNVGAAAERLIAAERGDVLEERGWPSVAEDVAEGVALQTVSARVAGDPDADEIRRVLGAWIEEDRKAGIR